MRKILFLFLSAVLVCGWAPGEHPSTAQMPEPLTWTHTSQADWMAGERDHLDVRTLDAMGWIDESDQDPRGAMRLRSQPGTWKEDPASPVVVPGAPGDWDDATISEAKVVYDGQTFHLWYAGRRRGPPGLKMPMDLGYATSSDGIHWQKSESNPVLVRGPLGSYDENMITAPYVLYDGEQFRMWYSAVDFDGDWSINYATSPDGVRWHKYESNPLLTETHDYRWDAVYIAEPCVLFNGSLFEMWYNGASATTETLLGHATSPDGIHWTRFEENRPVLTVAPDGAWDDFSVARAYVSFDGELYKMWYEGHNGSTWRIGYALSQDGIRWTRPSPNPIADLGKEGTWNSRVSSEPYVLFDGQTYWLWHSGYDGDKYRIGLMTAPAVYEAEGTFVSPAIVAERPVQWGTLQCDVDLPPGSGISFEIATNNDSQTWSGWQPVTTSWVSGTNSVDLAGLALPQSHSLRYRLTLSTIDPSVSPLVREVVFSEVLPDFGLSTDDELTLQTGQGGQIQVKLEPKGGFASPVELSLEGALPDGLEATWSPGALTPPGTATLNLQASSSLDTTPLTLTIAASSDGIVHQAHLALRLVAPTSTPAPTATPTSTPTPPPSSTPTAVATPTVVATPTPTPTPLPPPPPLPPVQPQMLWLGIGLAGAGVLILAGWLMARGLARPERPGQRRAWWRHGLWGILWLLIALAGIVLIWRHVETRRLAWEAYQSHIRPGVYVAGSATGSADSQPTASPAVEGHMYVGGIDASGMTLEEAREAIEAREIAPLRRTIVVHYMGHTAELHTEDLDLETNVDEIVAQAAAVGAGEDTNAAFGQFLLRNPTPVDVNLPLTYTFDYERLVPWVEGLAVEIESPLVEHAFDEQTLTFTRGRAGVHMDIQEALRRLQAAVSDLTIDQVELPVQIAPPQDWTDDQIKLAVSHAAPIWEQPAIPASSQQITIPFDAERWLGPNTPAASWQPTRTMTGYAFSPGQMGRRLDVTAAQHIIRTALDTDTPEVTARVLTDVMPAPLTLTDVKPLLLEIAGHFDGFTGFYVQDLESGQEIRHNTYVTTSGMSMIKVAIMVTAYRTVARPFSAELQEAMSMMIAHSINEKSNYVILQIGEGDFQLGLRRINETLQALDMRQTYIHRSYRTEEGPYYDPIEIPERPPVEVPPEEQIDLWPDTAMQTSLSDQAALFEALYRGTEGTGKLLGAFPALSPQDCQEMLDLLKTNPTRTFLGPGFANDVPMAHKNGFGGGSSTDERMNVGIIWPPEGRPYLVGLYQWDHQDWIHWLRVWPQQIEFSTTLYNYFCMPPPMPAPPAH
jgi:beta-lactamase class A